MYINIQYCIYIFTLTCCEESITLLEKFKILYINAFKWGIIISRGNFANANYFPSIAVKLQSV